MAAENESSTVIPYLLGGAAVLVVGGGALWWWNRRAMAAIAAASAQQRAALSASPPPTTTIATTSAQQALHASTPAPVVPARTPAASTPGVTGDAAVARHAGCVPYDENQQSPASLSPASLRHQDVWNDRALMDAAWFARIQQIVTEDLDALHAPADPNLMGRTVAALITAHVPPVSNSLDQYHYLQQAARKLDVLVGRC